MPIRIPIREGMTLIVDDYGAEVEFTYNGTGTTYPLDIDALLTLRDGCDAAFKLWQVKQRNRSETKT